LTPVCDAATTRSDTGVLGKFCRAAHQPFTFGARGVACSTLAIHGVASFLNISQLPRRPRSPEGIRFAWQRPWLEGERRGRPGIDPAPSANPPTHKEARDVTFEIFEHTADVGIRVHAADE